MPPKPLSSGPPASGKGPPGKGPLGPPGKGGKFGAWIKKHPGQAAAAAGVVAVGGFALYRSKAAGAGNTAASNGTTGTAGGTSGYTDTGTATPYDYGTQYGGGASTDSSANDAALQAQLNTLSGQLSKLSFSKNGYLKTVSENGPSNPTPVKVVTKPKPKAKAKPKAKKPKITVPKKH